MSSTRAALAAAVLGGCASACAPVPSTPPLPPPPAPPPGDPVVYAGRNAVRVRVESDDPRTFLYRADPRGAWSLLCAAPCDFGLDPSGLYRIGGNAEEPQNGQADVIAASKPFRIDPRLREQTFRVRTRSSMTPVFGGVLLGLGAASVTGGAIVLGAGSGDGATVVGATLVPLGVVSAIAGGVLLALPGTIVTNDRGERVGARPPALFTF